MLTTHDLAHVEKVCDTIAVLKAGKVLASGAIDALRSEGAGIEVRVSGDGLDATLLERIARQMAPSCRSPLVEQKDTARVICNSTQRTQLGTELVKRGVVLCDLTTVRASLEDTFLALLMPSNGASNTAHADVVHAGTPRARTNEEGATS